MGAFSNNTIINDSGSTVYDSFSESPSPNADDWDLENNIFGGNGLFIGDATGDGDGTLSGHFSNTLFDYNLNVGSSSGNYAAQGANNAFPANVTAVGFTDAANDDYSLDAGSTYKNAGSDGNDPGVNWAKLIEYGLVA
jgi:hypothetical protein